MARRPVSGGQPPWLIVIVVEVVEGFVALPDVAPLLVHPNAPHGTLRHSLTG